MEIAQDVLLLALFSGTGLMALQSLARSMAKEDGSVLVWGVATFMLFAALILMFFDLLGGYKWML